MSIWTRALVAGGLLAVSGCSTVEGAYDSTLDWFGGGEERQVVAGLDEVLLRADDTPGKQGYLYVAMVESQVAAQYGAFAAAAGDDLGAIQSALGEMIYALDPKQAPAWGAKSTGIVAGWAGRSYGLRRASDAAERGVRTASERAGAATTLRDNGLLAARCIANTSARAERLLVLGGQALDTSSTAELASLLPAIDQLARELNDGAAGAATSPEGCGLRQAVGYLDLAAPTLQSS